jgi:monoamine oxidase
MQRRKFIKDAITGLPILLLSPTILASSCHKNDENINPNDKKIVVIGAGISGLAAAKKLKQKGYNVIVLEADSKIGGRLKTNRTLGIAFDEGASWIHGTNGNPLTKIAQQAGMNTVFTDDESRISYDIGGVLRSATTYDNAETEPVKSVKPEQPEEEDVEDNNDIPTFDNNTEQGVGFNDEKIKKALGDETEYDYEEEDIEDENDEIKQF